MSATGWTAAPQTVRGSHEQVQVWRFNLDAPPEVLQRCRALLSADEVARAQRFIRERDRARFTVARGTLRLILARYLGCAPEELRFRYSAYGKPELGEPHGAGPLRFNVSHSGSLALIAVGMGRAVGVDLEQVRTNVAFAQIAARTFSPGEQAALRALPRALQLAGFFNCWTRKEAYIKARGLGLALPLDQFDVSVAPEAPAALLSTAGEPAAASQWSLQALAPGDGFVGAVAAEGLDWQVVAWQWAP